MLKGNKFRIYPNEEQRVLLNKTFGCCRKIYNIGLNMRITAYHNHERCSYGDTCAQLTALKKTEEFNYLKEVDAIALQQSLRNLDDAYARFFSKQNKFPKFKSKHNQYYSYKTMGLGLKLDKVKKIIYLPKIGWIDIRLSTIIGKIHSVTVEKHPSGKYFVSILHDIDIINRKNKGNMIGIDVGIKEFYTDNNGNIISNPKFLSEPPLRLIKEQCKLNRKQIGSKNWEKQRIKVARAYEKITNQKTDFLHKLSSLIINENQIIVVEDLDIQELLVKNKHSSSKKITNASWGKFFEMLKYKSQWYGNQFIQIDTYYPSSQLCFNCGYKNSLIKDLSIREWDCPMCGQHHQRDINAAKNILKEGLKSIR